jgi:hypothetical protein
MSQKDDEGVIALVEKLSQEIVGQRDQLRADVEALN